MDQLNAPGSFIVPPRISLNEELCRSRQEGRGHSAKKGEPWTEDEHRAFLQGLQRLGKGAWKQIAKFYVPSRTPTQVASHAQKHFLRMAGSTKRRSRFSAVEEEAHIAGGSNGAVGGGVGAGSGGDVPATVMGHPLAGIAVGVPLGVAPPWLPPPLAQQPPDLPILPVGSLDLRPHAASPSRDSRATSSGTSSPPCNLSSGSSPPQQHVQQPQPAIKLEMPRPLPPPTSRQQQLLRLLEMREQQMLASGGYPGTQLMPAGPPRWPVAAITLTLPCSPTSAVSASAALPDRQPPSPQQLQAQQAGSTEQGLAFPGFPQPPSAHSSPVKVKLEQLEIKQEPPGAVPQAPVAPVPRQPAPKMMPPLWGSVPEGLAMLAEAAACKLQQAEQGDDKGSSDQDAEADSDADTTVGERHTV